MDPNITISWSPFFNAITVKNVIIIATTPEAKPSNPSVKFTALLVPSSIKAVNLLCKMAAKGIDEDKIIDSIIYIMENFSDEDIISTLGFLSQVKNNQKILRTINNIGSVTREQLIFLKAVALSDEVLDLSLILENESGQFDLSSVSEDLRLKSAISFFISS